MELGRNIEILFSNQKDKYPKSPIGVSISSKGGFE